MRHKIAHRKKYEMMKNVGENTHTNITENIHLVDCTYF